MAEWTKKQKRGFLIIALVHLELGLLLGIDIFFASFAELLVKFDTRWSIVCFIIYGVSSLLFVLGIVLDYRVWHKGIETIFKKKEAEQ